MTNLAWPEVTLRELCSAVQYGFTASAATSPIGPKFLRITDIVPPLIDWQTVPYCEMDDDDFEKYQLHDGDIVIARTGATTGYAKYLKSPPPAVFASYLVRLVLEDRADKRFIGAVVTSDAYKRFVMQNAGGAAQPNANAQVLSSFRLRLPPLPVQRQIASILCAYDDLIENNTRRIAILGEMARRWYEQWFVIPRNAAVAETGKQSLPSGWRLVTLRELCSAGGGEIRTGPFGSQLHRHDYEQQGVPVVMPTNLIGNRISEGEVARVSEGTAERLSAHRLHVGDIVYGRRGDIGRKALIGKREEGWLCGTGCLRITPGVGMVHTLYLDRFLGEDGTRATIMGRAVGATMPNLNTRILEELDIVLPPKALQDEFGMMVEPLDNLSRNLASKNANLRAQRDLLLPKLISGEVDVSQSFGMAQEAAE